MSYIGRGTDKISNVEKLDNISFSGSTATFNLTKGGTAFIPSSAECIRLAIDGIEQGNNYTVSGSQITFDFTPSGSSTNNWIYHIGVGVITTPADGTVTLDKLSATGTKNGTTFLAGDNTFKTISGTTINNNADNRVITGSGTANTLEGEANLTYNGTILGVGGTGDLGTGVHIKTADSGASVDGNADELVIEGSGQSGITIASGNTDKGNIFFADDGSTARGKIIYDHGNDLLRFDTAETERIRFLSTGTLDINVGGGTVNTSYWTMKLRQTGNASATHYMMAFAKQNDSTVGSIQTDGSNTSYNTSSDYRLKENIVDLTGAIDRVKTLKPKRFNFKDNPSKTQDGFLAHEIITVPEAVNGTKDATETYTDDDGNEQTRILPQQLDQSKLVPLLTSALQEAITKIETLETRVQTLEENNGSN